MTTYRQREGHWSHQPDPISAPIVNVSASDWAISILTAVLGASPVLIVVLFMVF